VIATNHGAFPEGILPERSGFLVPERDAPAIADRLSFFASHPRELKAFGRAGRQYVESRYDIRQLNSELIQIYTGAIADFSRCLAVERSL
jgi:colanic acid/amylovoran biosynthesis glycosyltransferase